MHTWNPCNTLRKISSMWWHQPRRPWNLLLRRKCTCLDQQEKQHKKMYTLPINLKFMLASQSKSLDLFPEKMAVVDQRVWFESLGCDWSECIFWNFFFFSSSRFVNIHLLLFWRHFKKILREFWFVIYVGSKCANLGMKKKTPFH